MRLLNDLLLKCYKYELNFNLSPRHEQHLDIFTFDENGKYVGISVARLQADSIEEPKEVILNRMHQEVDNYLNRFSSEFGEGFETKPVRGKTENERLMQEAGYKQSDFL